MYYLPDLCTSRTRVNMKTVCSNGVESTRHSKNINLRFVSTHENSLTGTCGSKYRRFGGGYARSPGQDIHSCSYPMLCRSRDESRDRDSSDEYELSKLEIQEPAFEQGAEQAALSVIGATVFGAILWGVLGPTKGEGVFRCILMSLGHSTLIKTSVVVMYRIFCWIFAGAELVSR